MIRSPFDATFVARMEDFTEAMLISWQSVCCRIGSDPEEEIGEEDSPSCRRTDGDLVRAPGPGVV